tara:strand:+ start:1091 stop:1270 length:180 start_codon:yes stop_codon:yes gene_type:complete
MCCRALAKNNTKSMTEKNGGTVNLSVIAFALVGGSLSHPFVLGDFGFTAYFYSLLLKWM